MGEMDSMFDRFFEVISISVLCLFASNLNLEILAMPDVQFMLKAWEMLFVISVPEVAELTIGVDELSALTPNEICDDEVDDGEEPFFLHDPKRIASANIPVST